MFRRSHLAAISLLLVSACSSSLERVLGDYGYTALRPPSTLLEPGAMVSLTHTDPFEAAVICSAAESLGSDRIADSSATETTELSKRVSDTFELDAKAVKGIQGNAKLAVVETVKLTLLNPTIIALDDTDVITNIDRRAPACAAAVSARIRTGQPVSMIRSALKADVVYQVQIDDSAGLDASAKAEVTKGVALELGLARAETSTTTIRGTGLFWGIINDNYLANLSKPKQ